MSVIISYVSRVEMMCGFTRPQRTADVPKARPTRNQLGLVVSGLELVNTDLDPTEKRQNIIKNPPCFQWKTSIVVELAVNT